MCSFAKSQRSVQSLSLSLSLSLCPSLFPQPPLSIAPPLPLSYTHPYQHASDIFALTKSERSLPSLSPSLPPSLSPPSASNSLFNASGGSSSSSSKGSCSTIAYGQVCVRAQSRARACLCACACACACADICMQVGWQPLDARAYDRALLYFRSLPSSACQARHSSFCHPPMPSLLWHIRYARAL